MNTPRPGNQDDQDPRRSRLMDMAMHGLFPTNTLPYPRQPVGKGAAKTKGKTMARSARSRGRGRSHSRKHKLPSY